jgi:cytochrome P450 family 6
MRFGLLQSKLGLTSLLRNYKFKVSERTKGPLIRMIPSSLLLTQKEESGLNVLSLIGIKESHPLLLK